MNMIEIGRVHTPHKIAPGTPIQPSRATGIEGTVIIRPEFSEGLQDLEGFERIWLVFFCHRSAEAKMRVIPYRDTVHRGLFSTRAPARPNPIGISCVRLGEINGNRLSVFDVDLLDDTPLLDIKPYVPEYDSHDITRCGWIDSAGSDRSCADGRFHE